MFPWVFSLRLGTPSRSINLTFGRNLLKFTIFVYDPSCDHINVFINNLDKHLFFVAYISAKKYIIYNNRSVACMETGNTSSNKTYYPRQTHDILKILNV